MGAATRGVLAVGMLLVVASAACKEQRAELEESRGEHEAVVTARQAAKRSPRATRATKPKTTHESPAATWRIRVGKTAKGSPSIHAELLPKPTRKDDLVEERTPLLALRCQDEKLEAFFVVDLPPAIEFGHDDATVELRFDRKGGYSRRLRKSESGEQLFIERPKRFLQRLRAHRTLSLRYRPYGAKAKTAIFSLHDTTRAVATLKRGCKL